MNRRARLATSTLAVCLIWLTGCDQSTDSPRATPDNAARPAGAFRLPVSLNEVMVTMVNHSADPIWQAASRSPATDQDWRYLERMAFQLQIAGALLVIPGNGPRDEEWTSDSRWIGWANQLESAGAQAVKAIAARDLSRVASTGDEIVVLCEGCHAAFKPGLPTSGKFGEPSTRANDFQPPGSPGEQ